MNVERRSKRLAVSIQRSALSGQVSAGTHLTAEDPGDLRGSDPQISEISQICGLRQDTSANPVIRLWPRATARQSVFPNLRNLCNLRIIRVSAVVDQLSASAVSTAEGAEVRGGRKNDPQISGISQIAKKRSAISGQL